MVSAVETEFERKPFCPTPFQTGIILDDRRFVVAASGRGCGKTTGVTQAILLRMEDREVHGVRYPKYPDGTRILVFAPSYPQMRKGTIKTFDEWFDESGYVVKKLDGNEPERRLVRGIEVYFRNASNPDQTRSHQPAIIWLDEYGQMNNDVLRLANASQRQFGRDFNYQTYITSTPRGQNVFYRAFRDQIEAERMYVNTYRGETAEARENWCFGADGLNADPRVGYYHTTTYEAVNQGVDLPENYIGDMGYAEGTEMHAQEVLGDFVSWAGLVFAFNEIAHCPDPFTPPPFTTVYGGIDVGYGGYTAIELTGISKAGAMYTFREYYRKSVSLHEWLPVVAEWTQQYRVRRWFIDSAANIEFNALKAAGYPVQNSMKARDAAGSAVGYINSKLKQEQLFIDRQACPFLVSEIMQYQYKETQTEDDVTFLDKVKPNQADHAIDAWRYHILPLSAATRRYGQTLEYAIA